MSHKLTLNGVVGEKLKEAIKNGTLHRLRPLSRSQRSVVTIPKLQPPSFIFNPCAEIPLGGSETCKLPVPENHKKRQLRSIDDDWMS